MADHAVKAREARDTIATLTKEGMSSPLVAAGVYLIVFDALEATDMEARKDEQQKVASVEYRAIERCVKAAAAKHGKRWVYWRELFTEKP